MVEMCVLLQQLSVLQDIIMFFILKWIVKQSVIFTGAKKVCWYSLQKGPIYISSLKYRHEA